MGTEEKYYLVKKKALPDALMKVVEVKHLLDSKKVKNVQEATDRVGISRSCFYKYKDDIFPFHDNTRGKTITFTLQVDDERGLLSQVLSIVAEEGCNILTIHQTIPVNQIAMLTLSVEVPQIGDPVQDMIEKIEGLAGVQYLKILARE